MNAHGILCISLIFFTVTVFNYTHTAIEKKSIPKIVQEMVDQDQNNRFEALRLSRITHHSLDDLFENLEIEALNKKHLIILKEIINDHGWPRLSEFGAQTCQNVWLLVQHADHDVKFQKECFKMIEALAPYEADQKLLAYLYDRICINEKRPQKYGTQLDENSLPLTLSEPAKVDQYRKEMGLDSLEEYIELSKALHKLHCESKG